MFGFQPCEGGRFGFFYILVYGQIRATQTSLPSANLSADHG